jgi:Zn-dependent protease with chaperone function
MHDWDVLATQTLAALPAHAIGAIDLERVRHAALVEAGKEHALAVQAVASPRYTALVLQFSRWLLTAGWRDGLDAAGREALAQALFATHARCCDGMKSASTSAVRIWKKTTARATVPASPPRRCAMTSSSSRRCMARKAAAPT